MQKKSLGSVVAFGGRR